jgi:hypothetical protein
LRKTALILSIGVIAFSMTAGASGQRGRGGAPQPQPGKAGAPFDMTGYWVSMVTEDWRYRMFTPAKGDYQGIPLNAEGRRAADAWDPAKDEAAGEQCRSYGAANIMRVPERLHVTWQDDQTMKLETDAGNQTRIFFFGIPNREGGDWQGISKASWDFDPGFGVPAQRFDPQFGQFGKPAGGSLKVVTTRLKPGYLRKNGVPYSASAILTEYYDRVTEPNGNTYLVVTITVEDPMYLGQPYMASTSFRKQSDASGWKPKPCTSR